MPSTIRVSHSAIRKLISCPRKVFFSDELRLFPVNGSIAMRYGSGFHAGMEGYYSNGKDITKGMQAAADYWKKPTKQIFNEDYRNLESLITSIILYDEQYKNAEVLKRAGSASIIRQNELSPATFLSAIFDHIKHIKAYEDHAKAYAAHVKLNAAELFSQEIIALVGNT